MGFQFRKLGFQFHSMGTHLWEMGFHLGKVETHIRRMGGHICDWGVAGAILSAALGVADFSAGFVKGVTPGRR